MKMFGLSLAVAILFQNVQGVITSPEGLPIIGSNEYYKNAGSVFNTVLLSAAENEFRGQENLLSSALDFQWDQVRSEADHVDHPYLVCVAYNDHGGEAEVQIQRHVGKDKVAMFYSSVDDNMMCFMVHMKVAEAHFLQTDVEFNQIIKFLHPVSSSFKFADNMEIQFDVRTDIVESEDHIKLRLPDKIPWHPENPNLLVYLSPGASKSAAFSESLFNLWRGELQDESSLEKLSNKIFWSSHYKHMLGSGGSKKNLKESLVKKAKGWNSLLSGESFSTNDCNFNSLEFESQVPNYFYVKGLEGLDSDISGQDCLVAFLGFLSSRPEVLYMQPRPVMEFKNSEASWITQSDIRGKHPIWNMGLTGKGQIIGMADSGIDQRSCFFNDETGNVPASHPENQHNPLSYPYLDKTRRKIVQYFAYADSGDPVDGHGTHCAGSVIGSAPKDVKVTPKGCGVGYARTCTNGCLYVTSNCTLDTGFANLTCYKEYIVRENITTLIKAEERCRSSHFGCPYYDCDDGRCGIEKKIVPQMTGMVDTFEMNRCHDNPEITIPENKGMAPEAKIAFFDLGDKKQNLKVPPHLNLNLFPISHAAGSKLHTNSWGMKDGDARYYSMDMEVDAYCWEHKDFLPIFAAGNGGSLTFSGTVGSPGNSKNSLTVGAAQTGGKRFSFNESVLADFSSKGPTIDGRIKPDVVAPGAMILSVRSGGYDNKTSTCDMSYKQGTSMATPVVAGNAALVREFFEDGMYWSQLQGLGFCTNSTSGKLLFPYMCKPWSASAALVKAMLVHSGQSMRYLYLKGDFIVLGQGPDVAQGFGRVQLDKVIPTMTKRLPNFNLFVSDLEFIPEKTDIEYSFRIQTSANELQELKATMVWTDPPGYIFSKRQLIHDLDIKITSPTGEEYFPNELGKHERLNVIERVIVKHPAQGIYKIKISSEYLSQGRQPYALVITGTGYVSDKKITKRKHNPILKKSSWDLISKQFGFVWDKYVSNK